MRAHQIMSRQVVTIRPEASVIDAINAMLAHRVGGLPVVDSTDKLVGMISESDFIRRAETCTERRRGRLLSLLAGPDRLAADFVKAHGRKVFQIMTQNPVTVTEGASLQEIADLMSRRNLKRLPVMRGERVVGIVARADFLPAVAALRGDEQPNPGGDDKIRSAILRAIGEAPWRPTGLNVTVEDCVATLRGVVSGKNARRATIIAAETVPGVRKVEDHLCDKADYPPAEEDDGGDPG